MTGYTITVPDYADTVNMEFSAAIGERSFVFTCRWFDDIWHLQIVVNEEDTRSCLVFPGTVHFKYDELYSMYFDTRLETIGYEDLAGMSIQVVLNES